MAKPKIERLEAYKKYKMELHEAMLQKQLDGQMTIFDYV